MDFFTLNRMETRNTLSTTTKYKYISRGSRVLLQYTWTIFGICLCTDSKWIDDFLTFSPLCMLPYWFQLKPKRTVGDTYCVSGARYHGVRTVAFLFNRVHEMTHTPRYHCTRQSATCLLCTYPLHCINWIWVEAMPMFWFLAIARLIRQIDGNFG